MHRHNLKTMTQSSHFFGQGITLFVLDWVEGTHIACAQILLLAFHSGPLGSTQDHMPTSKHPTVFASLWPPKYGFNNLHFYSCCAKNYSFFITHAKSIKYGTHMIQLPFNGNSLSVIFNLSHLYSLACGLTSLENQFSFIFNLY